MLRSSPIRDTSRRASSKSKKKPLVFSSPEIPRVSPEIVHEYAVEQCRVENTAVGRRFAPAEMRGANIIPHFRETPQAWLKDWDNNIMDMLELDHFIFGCTPRKDILHDMVVWQLAKRRQGTHKNLYKTEVAKSSKKQQQQKGSGRARHGSYRAPIFVGGGRTFPKRPRDYSFKLNKKVRRLALRMALTTKYQQGNLLVVDSTDKVFEPEEIPKTKKMASIIKNLGVDKVGGCLLIDGASVNKSVERAMWNLYYVDMLPTKGINVYDCLRREKLILTRDAIDQLEQRFAPHKEIEG